MLLKIKNFLKRIVGKKIFYEGERKYTYRHNGLIIKSSSYVTLFKGLKTIFDYKIYDFECSNEKPLIVDGGANIGLASIFWMKKFPEANIIAFEPSKDVFPLLVENLRLNGINNVETINAALSDVDGTISFTSDESLPYSGSIRLEKNLSRVYDVKTIRLKNILKDRKIDLLKLDIEGAEKFVFPDIKECLDNIDKIFLEYHLFENEEHYLSEILKILEGKSFDYVIEHEKSRKSPFLNRNSHLGQKMQLNIWAFRS